LTHTRTPSCIPTQAGLNKVIAKKLLSVCRTAVEERKLAEAEAEAKMNKVLERKQSLAKVARRKSMRVEREASMKEGDFEVVEEVVEE
jgi:uncharacterized protein with von Willebrand factor type A (vWA) domain